jgi:FKBP-type peptidyl-prolyl cis-trans isomerase
MLHRGLRFLLVSACAVGSLAGALAGQTSGKVKSTDVQVGTGHRAAQGDLVTVLYVGTLADGTTFDSNTSKDSNPFAFVLGKGEVIKGWDIGVLGMAKGGKRKLVIPPELGYGSNAQASIPANSTLRFTITCLDIVKKGEENVFDKVDLKVGNGKTATKGSTVTVEYVGTLLNGKVFDSTKDLKKPVTFTIGAGEAIKAIDMGITGMREGGKRRLRLPPALAFGSIGNMARGIPGNAVVIYDIVLKKVGQGKH